MATNQDTTDAFIDDYSSFPFPIHSNFVEEDYKIFSRQHLGTGINGVVLKCKNRRTGQLCALKILENTRIARREIILHKRACANCPYIVQLLDVYENRYNGRQHLYIVMECMEGGELFNRIKRREKNPFTEREAAKYIMMLVEAIYHLHKMDIAHRDLKPENLLLTDTTENAILKLSDFGFAKDGHNESLPLITPLYTPYYVAPEILNHSRYDKSCDIWSLGVIVYILLCGYPPFYSESDAPLSPGMKSKIKGGDYEFSGPVWDSVSEETKTIIRRMLTVEVSQRITIDEIRQCQWLKELTSERSIDMVSLDDDDLQIQLQTAVASAIDQQRRTESSSVKINGPGASRVAKRAAKRNRQQTFKTNIDKTSNDRPDANHENSSVVDMNN